MIPRAVAAARAARGSDRELLWACVRMATRWACEAHRGPPSRRLAPRVKVGVFAAHSRRVASTEAKVLQVPALLIRQRTRIEWCSRLIVRSVESGMTRMKHARVLRDYRRGDCGGKDNNGAENFKFGNGGLRLIWGSPPLDVS